MRLHKRQETSVRPIGVSALKQRGFTTAGATVVLHVEIKEKIPVYDHMLFYYEFRCHVFKLCGYHISIW